MRGHFEGLPVVLASATPALESLAMVEAGRYRHIVLPARFGGATLPDLAAIDMRADPPDRGRWLAPPLVAALADRLEKGEQSLLRSEEHTSELQSLMRISYAVFCLKNKIHDKCKHIT